MSFQDIFDTDGVLGPDGGTDGRWLWVAHPETSEILKLKVVFD